MKTKLVKDLMLELTEYPCVQEEGTLLDAVLALDQAQKRLTKDRQPHRAVLVVNREGDVVGKIGQLAFIKALEPKYDSLGDLELLSKSGLDSGLINSMIANFNFWHDSLTDICARAHSIWVRDVMVPISVSIDENATLADAIHQIVMAQTLSLLVTRESRVVGILRLSDLFSEITSTIKKIASSSESLPRM